MPLLHALILIFFFAFGSLGAEYLKSVGFLDYAFYVMKKPGVEELSFSIVQVFFFAVFLLLGKYALGSVEYSSKIKMNSLIKSSKNIRLYALLFLLIFSFFVTIYSWEELFSELSSRHSGNHNLNRFTFLVVILCSFIFGSGTYIFRLLTGILIVYVATISGAIGSSRSVALPFILLGLIFFVRKNYITSALLFYLAIVAIRTAFAVRGLPSYSRFWDAFLTNFFALDLMSFFHIVMQYSFPGLTTIQASMHAPGYFSIERLSDFFLYISPIPSAFLPSHLFQDMSLSYVLGIDKSRLGINYDIFSEGIFWFGKTFAWIYTVSVVFIILLPYYCAKNIAKIKSPYFYILSLMSALYMIVGGQVMTLRAGSRIVIALTLVVIIVAIMKKIRFMPRRFS